MNERLNPDPEYRFIYVEHDGLENAKATWEKIKDCDIILQEEVGLTEEQKNEWEKMIVLATTKPWTITGFDLRRKFLAREEKDWGFFLIASAVKTGKEFHFIDVRSNSLAMQINIDAKEFYSESFRLLRHGAPAEALEKLEISLIKYAQSARIRTKTILVQIQTLKGNAKDEWKNKKIGIIQGAAHEATFETFKQASPNQKAEKIISTPELIYPIFTNLIKQLEISPKCKIKSNDLIKILISSGILFPYLQVTRHLEMESVLEKLANKIILTLTHPEINIYWNVILETSGKASEFISATFWRIAHTIAQNYGLEEPTLHV